MLREEQKIIDKHMLAEVFKTCHIGETEVDQAKMSDARITLANIIYRIPDTYNTSEGWVVQKMRSKYVNIITIILPIIYQKDKVQYFNNKSSMMISKVKHGESINWVTIMYSQLIKELIKWEKCQKT